MGVLQDLKPDGKPVHWWNLTFDGWSDKKDNQKKRLAKWNCDCAGKCECGGKRLEVPAQVKNGNVKRCCLRCPTRLKGGDPTGQTINGWKIRRLLPQRLKTKGGKQPGREAGRIVEAICPVCKHPRQACLLNHIRQAHKKSCGCDDLFTKQNARKAYQEILYETDGTHYYSPRRFARDCKINIATLYPGKKNRRQGWLTSCSLNGGKGIPTKPVSRLLTEEELRGATKEQLAEIAAGKLPSVVLGKSVIRRYNRRTPYLHGPTVDRIKAAIDELPVGMPKVPGYGRLPNGRLQYFHFTPGVRRGYERPCEAKHARWGELREQGMSVAQIAERDGVTKKSVYTALKVLRQREERARRAATNGQPGANGKGDKQPHGGRKRNPQTEEVYKFCYEERIRGRKRSRVRRDAQARFGNRAPKEDCEVTTYANRYAKRHGLPSP